MKLKFIKRRKFRLVPYVSHCTIWHEMDMDGTVVKHSHEFMVLWLGYGAVLQWYDNKKWDDTKYFPPLF